MLDDKLGSSDERIIIARCRIVIKAQRCDFGEHGLKLVRAGKVDNRVTPAGGMQNVVKCQSGNSLFQ